MAIKQSTRFLTNAPSDTIGKKKVLATATQVFDGAANVVATQADGYIDPSLIKNSEVKVRVASEGITAGDEINIWDDTAVAKARKASASSFATRSFGYAENSALLGEDVRIISEGCRTGLGGLTIGEPVFLATAAGTVTQTPPTADDEIWQMLGEAISATEYRLEIGEAIEL